MERKIQQAFDLSSARPMRGHSALKVYLMIVLGLLATASVATSNIDRMEGKWALLGCAKNTGMLTGQWATVGNTIQFTWTDGNAFKNNTVHEVLEEKNNTIRTRVVSITGDYIGDKVQDQIVFTIDADPDSIKVLSKNLTTQAELIFTRCDPLL